MRKKAVTGSARATIDHDEIREWVEQRGGTPATVKRTRRGGSAGILRIDYPGYSGEESLEPISWDEFFERFEESNLAFLMQEKTASGRPSRFSKLVSRENVETDSDEPAEDTEEEPQRGAKKRGARKARAKKTATRSTKASPRSAGEGQTRAKKTAKRSTSRRGPARGSAATGERGAARKKTSKRMPSKAGPRVGRGAVRKKSGAIGTRKRTSAKRRAPTSDR